MDFLRGLFGPKKIESVNQAAAAQPQVSGGRKYATIDELKSDWTSATQAWNSFNSQRKDSIGEEQDCDLMNEELQEINKAKLTQRSFSVLVGAFESPNLSDNDILGLLNESRMTKNGGFVKALVANGYFKMRPDLYEKIPNEAAEIKAVDALPEVSPDQAKTSPTRLRDISPGQSSKIAGGPLPSVLVSTPDSGTLLRAGQLAPDGGLPLALRGTQANNPEPKVIPRYDHPYVKDLIDRLNGQSPPEQPKSETALQAYRRKKALHGELENLGKLLAQNFAKSTNPMANNPKLLRRHIEGKDNGANWIELTTGMTEEDIAGFLITLFKHDPLAAPRTTSLKDLRDALEEARELRSRSLESSAAASEDSPAFVQPEPTFELSKDAARATNFSEGAIVQAASQFNGLEAVNADRITSVTKYKTDMTQGPAVSMTAVVSAEARRLLCVPKKDFNAEEVKTLEVIPELDMISEIGISSFVKNGYLELFQVDPSTAEVILTSVLTNNSKIGILIQDVVTEEGGKKMTQVFAAAPSFQRAARPVHGSNGDYICRFLVKSQYEAIGLVAAIEADPKGPPKEVNLTMVGQGAFQNNPSTIGYALGAVSKAIEGSNVKLIWQLYNDKDVANLVLGAYMAGTENYLPKGLVTARGTAVTLEKACEILAKFINPTDAINPEQAMALGKLEKGIPSPAVPYDNVFKS